MEPSQEDLGIVRQWFVAFKKTPPRSWLHRVFCPIGFTHCYLMGFDRRLDYGIAIETTFERTDIRVITLEELDSIVPIAIAQGNVLVYRTPSKRVSQFGRHFSCVGLISHILGIESRWICTPNRLYQELIRLGAVEVSDA